MKEQTDEQLMALVQQEVPGYLEMLFMKYQQRLYNYFLKSTLDHESSQDLTQNTFLRVMKYRHSFRLDGVFRIWLFRIAGNLANDHHRQMHADPVRFNPAEHLTEDTMEGVTGERIEREQKLHRALALLPPDKRDLLAMSKFQGMKYEEIAAIRNISVGAVKVQVYRAISRLRQIYFEELDG